MAKFDDLDALEAAMPQDPANSDAGKKLQSGATQLAQGPLVATPKFDLSELEAPATTAPMVVPSELSTPTVKAGPQLDTSGLEAPSAPTPEGQFDTSELEAAMPAPANPLAVDVAPGTWEQEQGNFGGAFARGVVQAGYQTVATVPYMTGLAKHVMGDKAGAFADFETAMALEAQAETKSKGILGSKNVDEFGTWLGETAGQAVGIGATMIAGGGVAAVAGREVAKKIIKDKVVDPVVRQALLAKATKIGALSGVAATGFPLNTGGNIQEQYKATKDINAGVAVATGLAQTGLDLLMPAKLLGSTDTLLKSMLKGGLIEAGTESVQELLTIAGRSYVDPKHSFFDTKTWTTEIGPRMIEAGAAGFVGGGMFGVVGRTANQKVDFEGPDPGLLPKAELKDRAGWETGLTYLRGKIKTKAPSGADLDQNLKPENDVYEAGGMLADTRKVYEREQLSAQNMEATMDFQDAMTPRYVIMEEGFDPSEVMTDTELERKLATLPQNFKPRIMEVDQREMTPGGILADPFDLPSSPLDNRIYFAQGTTSEVQTALLQKYEVLGEYVADMQMQRLRGGEIAAEGRQFLLDLYKPLVDGGLRVVPSRGSSFIYKGELKGKMVEPPTTTGRSFAVTAVPVGATEVDAKTLATVMQEFMPAPELANYTYMALDTNKLKFGEVQTVPDFANGRIYRKEQLSFRSDLSEAEKTELAEKYIVTFSQFLQATETTADLIYKMYEEGVQVHPKFAARIVASKDLTTKLTRGVVTPGIERSKGNISETIFRTAKQVAKTYVERNKGKKVYTPSKTYLSKENLSDIKALMPMLEQANDFLNKLAVKFKMPPIMIEIIHSTQPSPYANMDKGAISIPVNSLRNLQIGTNAKGSMPLFNEKLSDTVNQATMLQVLFHEFGHLVSGFNFYRLPAHVQQRIFSSYEKARLSFSLGNSSWRTHLQLADSVEEFNPVYALRFEEYMAEQFRRYAQQQFVLNPEGAFFSNYGKQMEAMAKEVEKTFPEHIVDIMNPSWEYSGAIKYMEVLPEYEQLAFEGVQKFGLPDSFGLSASQSIEYVQTYEDTLKEVEEWRQAFPPDINVVLEPGESTDNVGGEWVSSDPLTGKETLRLWVGALANRGSSGVVAHEAVHAIWHKLSPRERQTLASTGRKFKVMPPGLEAKYFNFYKESYLRLGLSAEDSVAAARSEVDQEYAAWLVQKHHNGVSYGQADTLLDKILELFEKVKALLGRRKITSYDQIIVQIKRGEVVKRKEQAAQPVIQRPQFNQGDGPIKVILYDDVDTKVVPGPVPGTVIIQQTFNGDNNVNFYLMQWDKPLPQAKDPYEVAFILESEAKAIAVMEMEKQGPLGYEEMWTNKSSEFDFKKNGIPYMDKMLEWVGQNFNQKMRPSGHLYDDGYRMWKRRDPASLRFHIPDPRTLKKGKVDKDNTEWYSPRHIKYRLAITQLNVEQEAKSRGIKPNLTRSYSEMIKWKQMLEQVPESYWKDPISLVAFAREPASKTLEREFNLGHAQRGLEIADNQVMKAATGMELGPVESDYDRMLATLEDMQRAEQAKALGLPANMATPVAAESTIASAIFGRYGANNPAVRAQLSQQSFIMDRISWFSKWAFSTKQMAWRNPDNRHLQEYNAFKEEMNAFRMRWITRAQDTLVDWRTLPFDQQEALTSMLFWATEMEYLGPNDPPRYPTPQEIAQYMSMNNVAVETYAVYQQVEADFQAYLTEVETVTIANITRRNSTLNPVNGQMVLSNAGQTAIAKLQADMAAMRLRPYFPMVRFGQWTVTVRDPANQDRVSFHAAFATAAERDRVVRSGHLARAFPAQTISIGKVPEDVMEFQGLPAPILQQILAEARDPNSPFALTGAQISWLEQFSENMAPEKSFRKRWLQRKGTPGYSLDGMRIFSSYFQGGSSYLAKLAYKDRLKEQVDELRSSMRQLPSADKRSDMVEFVERDYRYIMEPSRDWHKFRSAVTIFQLGFSPAAAFVNLTQTPIFTMPYFAGIYGSRVYGLLANVAKSTKRTMSYNPATADPQFAAARAALVQMGKLETGAAPELAAYAQGGNLLAGAAGTAAQRTWRSFTRTSMWMFEQAERVNRELVLGLSWELSTNVTHPHMLEVERMHFHEINRLAGANVDIGGGQTVQLTYDTALRIVAAREAISRTQFEYGRDYRPRFLRSPAANSLLVFFSYTQAALYAFGNNPGMLRTFLTMAFLFGAMGLPGSDDMDEVIKAVARHYFGKDFSLEEEARKLVKDLTEGTPFSEVGPDLFLHGISRYSFGPGLYQEGLGFPKFDASANGSMGKIIPGFAETMKAMGRGDGWKDVTAELAKESAGAGFGQIFPMLQFLGSEFPSTEAKKWEKVMPRAVKAMSKAYRYGTEEKETNSKGATIAKFDMRNPDDLATVIAQGLGFAPTKINQAWQLRGEQYDKDQFFKNQRIGLLSQFDEALRNKNKGERAEVIQAIQKFNKYMIEEKLGAYAITPSTLKTSMAQRARRRAETEAGVGPTKQSSQLYRQVEKMYPGVEKVK